MAVGIGNQKNKARFKLEKKQCYKIMLLVFILLHYSLLATYFKSLSVPELVRIQRHQSVLKSKRLRLFNEIQDSYTPEHSWNILVITRVLSFALELGNN